MPAHVDDLGAVIDSLAGAPIHLVGHSYGAFVCLLYAMRQTQKLRSLVLAEPPAITLFVSSQPKPTELLKLLVTRPATALAIIKFAAEGVVPATKAIQKGDRERALEALGRGTLGAEAFRALSDDRREQARANLIDAELLGSGFAPIDQEAIRQLQVPTLLITSQNSPPMFRRLADRLAELLPGVKETRISEASHIMHEDNPEEYNSAVLSFLAELKK
jgi:pimeloyl-ACP methyl ester carboxylesterase